MKYTGTELDGKYMKAVAIEKGSRIGQFIYDLNTDNVDALLDKIDYLVKTVGDLSERLEIMLRQNNQLQDIIEGKSERVPEDRGYKDEKRRGGHGD